MQRILMAASTIYTHGLTGQFPARKAIGVTAKFNAKWGLDFSRQQAHQRRLRGEPSFRLFLYPEEGSTNLKWVVLRTGGKHPVLAEDDWLDLRNNHLEFRGYELLRLPYGRHDNARSREAGKMLKSHSWTWRMSDAYFEQYKKRIRSSLAIIKRTDGKNTLTYDQLVYSLHRAPGFRAVRDQVWDLRCYINLQRCRMGLPLAIFPPMPGWLRARSSAEYPLSVLVDRTMSGCGSWFP